MVSVVLAVFFLQIKEYEDEVKQIFSVQLVLLS